MQKTADSVNGQEKKPLLPKLFSTRNILIGTAFILSFIGLYFLSRYNYLLFHSAIEVFSIVVAIAIFTIAWNSRKIMDNNYLAFIGIAFLFIAGIDLLHTLSYKGIGIFPDVSANLATQLWIAMRYVFAFSLLIPLLFIQRRIRPRTIIVGYSLATAFLLISIFYWNIFPTAFVDGVGLTTFKIASEYAISVIFAIDLVLLLRNRKQLSDSVFKLMLLAIIAAIATELAFTLYTDVYGVANMVGHLLDFLSFYLIYLALVETGFSKPYDLLFRNLKQNEQSLANQTNELTSANQRLENEIIERKKIEQELTINQRLLQNVFDSMYEGVCILDKTGKVIDFNNAFIGINKFKDRADALKSIDSLGSVFHAYRLNGSYVPVEDWPATKALKGESGTGQEYIVERTDLGIHWITSNSYAPLRDENDEIIGAIQTMHDITERKTADEALRQRSEELEATQKKLEENACQLEEYSNQMEELANQRLSQLKNAERLAAIGATAGMVGHDLKNPLQTIIGELYFAKKDLSKLQESSEKEQIADNLREIETSVLYMNKIILDLQDYARPLKPECVNTDLLDLVNSVLKMVRIPDNITVSKDIDDLSVARTDPSFIKRSLTNLVNNAIQAMPNGGNLGIKGFTKDDRIYISISDTGLGIPDEIKPKLFTPMMTTKAKGQGFGLAVVKRLIEALDGIVAFESEVGKGTKFTIDLPADRQ